MDIKAHNEDIYRILICFKTVPDLDTVMEEDWKCIGDGKTDISYTGKQLGFWDEAALENGLMLGDGLRRTGRKAEVTALTIGEEADDEIFKNLYGVKCDRVVFWKSGEDLRFGPERTAGRIASFVKEEGGFDIILTGSQSPVGDSGTVPLALGEYLGLLVLTQVRELELRDKGILAISQSDGWERSYLCSTPLVCAMGNAKYPYLRVATLREKLSASKKQIVKRDDNGWTDSWKTGPPKLSGLYRRQEQRSCKMVEGETVQERAKQLYRTLKEAGLL